MKNPLRLPNTVKNTLMSCNCFQMQVAFNTKMPTIRSLLLLPIQRMHLVWFKKKKNTKSSIFDQSALKFINCNAKISHYESVTSILAKDKPKHFTSGH